MDDDGTSSNNLSHFLNHLVMPSKRADGETRGGRTQACFVRYSVVFGVLLHKLTVARGKHGGGGGESYDSYRGELYSITTRF